MAIKGLWPNSLKNSTDKLLAAEGTFTGEPEAISVTEQPQSVSVTVFTDEPSPFNGLQLQQSADGTNWDHIKKYTVEPNHILVVELNLEQRYFRVVYQTTQAQTLFRLQTRYNTRAVPSENAQPVELAYDGELVNQDLATRVAGRNMSSQEETVVELKIMNKHLSAITGQYFTKGDI